jgi:hypothetical protein
MDEDKNTRYVTGFSMSIKDSSEEEAKNKAERQAKVLTDIISVKRERYVSYYGIGYNMIKPDKTQRVTRDLILKYNILKDLEIDLRENKTASVIVFLFQPYTGLLISLRCHYDVNGMMF